MFLKYGLAPFPFITIPPWLGDSGSLRQIVHHSTRTSRRRRDEWVVRDDPCLAIARYVWHVRRVGRNRRRIGWTDAHCARYFRSPHIGKQLDGATGSDDVRSITNIGAGAIRANRMRPPPSCIPFGPEYGSSPTGNALPVVSITVADVPNKLPTTPRRAPITLPSAAPPSIDTPPITNPCAAFENAVL